MPISQGIWVYRTDDRGSVALFGPANSEASFVVRCNRAERRIYFSRAGSLDGGSGTMAFQASAGQRSYAAQNVTGEQPYIAAATGASDAYLDTIAYSRGRVTVAVTGQPAARDTELARNDPRLRGLPGVACRPQPSRLSRKEKAPCAVRLATYSRRATIYESKQMLKTRLDWRIGLIH